MINSVSTVNSNYQMLQPKTLSGTANVSMETSSYSSVNVSSSGLADNGLALLALLALGKQKNDEQVTTAEKIALLAMLLGVSGSPQNIDITMQAPDNLQVLNPASTSGYTAGAAPISAPASNGTLYDASV